VSCASNRLRASPRGLRCHTVKAHTTVRLLLDGAMITVCRPVGVITELIEGGYELRGAISALSLTGERAAPIQEC
jgi:hypothetical protein